jgi:hypothetical protein
MTLFPLSLTLIFSGDIRECFVQRISPALANRNRLSDGILISIEFFRKMTEQTKIVIADDHPIGAFSDP